MDQGIAKGDVSQCNGVGADNMTCLVVLFKNLESLPPTKISELKVKKEKLPIIEVDKESDSNSESETKIVEECKTF